MSSTSENTQITLQRNPLKLYIQDIYRATRSKENKYIYEMFGLKFKNVMLHGTVTAVFNTNASKTTTNFELSDPTGCIVVYYDSTKNNMNISTRAYTDLFAEFADASRRGHENVPIMLKLLNAVEKKKLNPLFFSVGDCLSVIGDIFVDELKNVRIISAYQCQFTSLERDLIWLEELRYLYEKFYLWKKE